MIRPLIVLTRPFSSSLAAVGTLIAVQISSHGQLLILSTLALGAANSLFAAGSMAINDWFDADLDQISKPHRPIPSGQVGRTHALLFAIVLFAIGFAATFIVSRKIAIYAGIGIILSTAYSLIFKRYLLVGNLLVATLACYPFISGGLLTQDLNKLIIPIAVTFIFVSGREILKDVEDTQGDSRFGIVSVANKWGESKAIYVGVILMGSSSILAIGQYLRQFNDVWFLVFVGPGILTLLFLGYRLTRDMSARNLSKFLKLSLLLMLWGTISFMIGQR